MVLCCNFQLKTINCSSSVLSENGFDAHDEEDDPMTDLSEEGMASESELLDELVGTFLVFAYMRCEYLVSTPASRK